jgi:hypothetical protein
LKRRKRKIKSYAVCVFETKNKNFFHGSFQSAFSFCGRKSFKDAEAERHETGV